MMRLAFAAGVTSPDAFYAMTLREVELVVEGHEEWWRRVRQHLAWTQANLINVHIGKGRKVKATDLLPRDDQRVMRERNRGMRREEDDDQPTSPKEFFAQLREREETQHNKEWWMSPEGRAMARLLADEDSGGYDRVLGETAADFLDAEFEDVDEE